MLKIKDNIDLKELEKFGFEYDCEEVCYGDPSEPDYDEDFYEWYELVEDGELILKVDSNGEFHSFDNFDTHIDYIVNVINDLIRAGLVENKIDGGIKYENL